ncbi:MAG: hypothetical protein M1819_004665 [Sarea resinae]|nr:MAG: hypothetical protein M1819_004665 [Sarea resinae]
MDITKLISTSRENALLLGDYNSYRAQLSRRLLVLRKKVARTSPKGKKYATRPAITAEDLASNRAFVHLILLTAERAWAQAMHMKSTHAENTAAKGISGSTRRHVISRLVKATKYANELVRLLEDRATTGASDFDVLEAQAYSSSLAGAASFEKQSWEECLREYSVSRIIYGVLGNSAKDDVFKDLLSNTIDPSIRYAAYQSRLPRTIAIPTVARRHFDQSNSQLVASLEKLQPGALSEDSSEEKKGLSAEAESIPRTISWRSRTVELEDAAIAQALASVAAAEAGLSQFLSSASDSQLAPKDIAVGYDDILIASQDAVDATKHAIDELLAEGVNQGDRRMQALQVTRTAVGYAMIGWRVGRNRILLGQQDGALPRETGPRKPRKASKGGKQWVEKEEGNGRRLAKLREQIVLLDATLQSLESIKELPGVAADTAFMEELEAKHAYFRALRCLTIARSHIVLSHTKNALALLSRAADISAPISSHLPTQTFSPSQPPSLDVSRGQAETLHQLLQQYVAQHRALVELQTLSLSTPKNGMPTSATSPLIQRLDEYPSGEIDLTNLVTYPPKLAPVPVKPLFFDVAWNYIDYPGRVQQVVANGHAVGLESEAGETAQEKKEAKRGWFGFGR